MAPREVLMWRSKSTRKTGVAPMILLGLLLASSTRLVSAQDQSSPPMHTFPSRYMNAKDTPLVEIAKGARVGKDTEAYWSLPADSPQRASHDSDVVIRVADCV